MSCDFHITVAMVPARNVPNRLPASPDKLRHVAMLTLRQGPVISTAAQLYSDPFGVLPILRLEDKGPTEHVVSYRLGSGDWRSLTWEEVRALWPDWLATYMHKEAA